MSLQQHQTSTQERPHGMKKLNRINARMPRARKFWCSCDMAKVSAGMRCPACRKKEGKIREKFGRGGVHQHVPSGGGAELDQK